MPNIIILLLLASSPTYIRAGDGTESWGSLTPGPSESECRPYIEKALQGAVHDSTEQQKGDDVGEQGLGENQEGHESPPSEVSDTESSETPSDEVKEEGEEGEDDKDAHQESLDSTVEDSKEESNEEPIQNEVETDQSVEAPEDSKQSEETTAEIQADSDHESTEDNNEGGSLEEHDQTIDLASPEDTKPESLENEIRIETDTEEISSAEELTSKIGDSHETDEQGEDSDKTVETEDSKESIEQPVPEETPDESVSHEAADSNEAGVPTEEENLNRSVEDDKEGSAEENPPTETTKEDAALSAEDDKSTEVSEETAETPEQPESTDEIEETKDNSPENLSVEEPSEHKDSGESVEADPPVNEGHESAENNETNTEPDSDDVSPSAAETTPVNQTEQKDEESDEIKSKVLEESLDKNDTESGETEDPKEGDVTESPAPEEELSMIFDVPEKLRSRNHIFEILKLNEENEEIEKALSKTDEHTLRELKKLYDAAIKPLEILYKYRELSNRHFGDPEIFSKPLILFMGPWSGGKSTIINYLLENEYKSTALRSGAEPSPAYFNIVMEGDREEVLDGTQLAADWTFSGLQKFGQGLLDRLRGLRLTHPLLKKVNIVEIPGILEIRKQVERVFPFNDACQWFIDRADIIFLVYDPSKLDVGPETEAILDQLKGREMQTRIVLNKADQVKPEELMRVQGTLIWNISPLMSSTEPPVMYSTSLWSVPYEPGSPSRLLYAQECAFLKDLRDAVEKRVENKIASARRFAVRVRNHAKMVDCYLTTYYNHKSFFGNKKKISDDIIEHPQNYHIYEGLSTLTNISRYDLPDPDVYKDFFRLNPVYEFQQLSSTCTYFRGCPINRLDVAIAYDLPELVGKYKKQAEDVLKSVKK